MARPAKEGLDYWPIDCGFFRDRKIRLLRNEFGVTGVYVVLLMLNKIYEGNGYYITWDEDECSLLAEECREQEQVVNEVVKGCLRRSIFDDGVFQVFGVLTSHGIQKRYLTAVGHNRTKIVFIKEYFLLDIKNENEVPRNILGKVALKSISPGENGETQELQPVPPGETDNEPELTPGKPHKEKKSKVKERKEKESKENDDNTATLEPAVHEQTPLSSSLTPKQEKLSRVIKYYTKHVNWNFSSEVSSLLQYYSEIMDVEVIMKACDIAVDENALQWSYVWGILKNFENEHIFTMEEYRRRERIHQNRKNRANRRRDGQTQIERLAQFAEEEGCL